MHLSPALAPVLNPTLASVVLSINPILTPGQQSELYSMLSFDRALSIGTIMSTEQRKYLLLRNQLTIATQNFIKLRYDNLPLKPRQSCQINLTNYLAGKLQPDSIHQIFQVSECPSSVYWFMKIMGKLGENNYQSDLPHSCLDADNTLVAKYLEEIKIIYNKAFKLLIKVLQSGATPEVHAKAAAKWIVFLLIMIRLTIKEGIELPALLTKDNSHALLSVLPQLRNLPYKEAPYATLHLMLTNLQLNKANEAIKKLYDFRKWREFG